MRAGCRSYEEQRRQHLAAFSSMLPGALARIAWTPERLGAFRTRELRDLLHHVKRRSPWHARRLAGLDAEVATEADLGRLPPMTKADLMEHWDEIVTDPRLSLAACERHLETLAGPACLLEEFHVVVSGGSSGQRGVSVFAWAEWARAYASYMRWIFRAAAASGVPLLGAGPAVVAAVTGSSSTHISVALAATFSTTLLETRPVPVTSPLAAIVDSLNRAQPVLLFGYASALHLLAAEAEAGRLHIRPRMVVSALEPLLTEITEALHRVWDAEVLNAYGTTEFGPAGVSCTAGAGIHVNDDLLVIEPVDGDGRALRVGEPAARYYATPLQQFTLPLVRYEITDEIRLDDAPCTCGSGFRRIADIQGRLDDVFEYPGPVIMHPHAFRSPLSRARHVVEYQVRQTQDGADIDVRTTGPTDLDELARRIAASLQGAGLVGPKVSIRLVEAIERTGVGEKLKRFVPLSSERGGPK